MKKTYLIGTRGSTLAIAQAQFMCNKLNEQTEDNISFELKKIITQGDKIQSKPLWQIDGKDFFTKELDEHLLSNKIDLVVHSLKDLSTKRPQGIELAAVTKRVNPADVLFIKRSTRNLLINKEFKNDSFVIGTSSPRRIYQLKNIKSYLPFLCEQKDIKIESKVLRGNVDTRLSKLLKNEYDAIILAAAGVERISYSQKGLSTLREIATELDYMILPLSDFTPAPGQGALGIDCRSNDEFMKSILQKINCNETKTCTENEKKIFSTFGGTCHLPLGIYEFSKFNKKITIINGTKDGKDVSETLIGDNLNINLDKKIFIGLEQRNTDKNIVWDELLEKKHHAKIDQKTVNLDTAHYVSTKFSLKAFLENTKKDVPVFAAGEMTHKEIAKAGRWCNGTSNSRGDEYLNQLKNSQSFNLFHTLKNDWNIWTNDSSESNLGKCISTYKKTYKEVSDQWKKDFLSCETYIWASFSQFQMYLKVFPEIESFNHMSGMGRTYKEMKKVNINCEGIINFKEFLNKLKK